MKAFRLFGEPNAVNSCFSCDFREENHDALHSSVISLDVGQINGDRSALSVKFNGDVNGNIAKARICFFLFGAVLLDVFVAFGPRQIADRVSG